MIDCPELQRIGKINSEQFIHESEHYIDFSALLQYNIFVILCLCSERDGDMAVSYDRLWKLLIDKHITKTEMRKQAGISTTVLAKMGKNETVSMDTLIKVSTALNCGLDDIVEIKVDEKRLAK